MKKIVALISLCVLIPAVALAVVGVSRVWFTSVPTASGEQPAVLVGKPILIYATVQNTTKDPITYTITYVANEKTIGTKTTVIPGYTEQATSIEWTLPKENTQVTVSVTKALDKNKKNIPALVGSIGSVIVSPVLDAPKIAVKGFFGKVTSAVEAFRLKKLAYFTNLKKEAQHVLGDTTINDIGSLMRTQTIVAPGQTAPTAQIEDRHTMQYVTFIYATAGESFFSHATLFYIVSIFLVFLVIRFIFRRFV